VGKNWGIAPLFQINVNGHLHFPAFLNQRKMFQVHFQKDGSSEVGFVVPLHIHEQHIIA
jgi:hypothetical protein